MPHTRLLRKSEVLKNPSLGKEGEGANPLHLLDVVGPAGQTSAYICSRVSGGGPSLFWKNRTVVMHPGRIDDNQVTERALSDAMKHAANQWNQASCSDFQFVIGEPAKQEWAGYNWLYPEKNQNIVFVRHTNGNPNSRWLHDPRQIAVTSVTSISGNGEILDADIELNADTFEFTNCGAGGIDCKKEMDLKNILTHEFGHVLGLAHPSAVFPNAEKTAMWPSSTPGETIRRAVTQDDKDGVCFIYPKDAQTGECYKVQRREAAAIQVLESTSCASFGDVPSLLCALVLVASLVCVKASFRGWKL